MIFSSTLKIREGCLESHKYHDLALKFKVGDKVITKVSIEKRWSETVKMDRFEDDVLECEVLDCSGN